MPSTDPYEILGASPIDSMERIKSKYRDCILKYHPDKPTGDAKKFKMVMWAYNFITNPESAGPNPDDIQDDQGSKKQRVKKQSAKNYRKNPKRKGRAARRNARRSVRQASEHVQMKVCTHCHGAGYVESRSRFMFGKKQRKSCGICDGKGTIDES